MDKREDAGEFYPGGKVISTRPVATGGDVKHSDFAGLDVKTNTIPDLRDAVRELGRRLGATVVTALAACVAVAATVQTVPINNLDFDANPSIVTNVVFDAPPDFSTNNTELVETIQVTAPVPDNYAGATMPGRLRMSLPEDSEFIEPMSIFDMYSFVFDDMPGKPRVVFRNGAFHIDCEYGSAVGIRDDFEGTVSFYLPDTPFEYYEFRYSMSPVATIEKVNLTAQALANTIDYSTNNTELVETIEAKAPTPDLSPFLRNDKQDSEVQIFGGRLSGFGFHADTGHNDNGWNQYTAHNGTALAQPLPSYIQSNPWNFLKQGEAIPTTGGVFNAYIHLNHKFSVGTWTQYVKPIESVGGSGIAFAFGDNVQTRAANTMVLGVGALNTNDWSFIWNGDANRMYFPTQPNMSNPYSTRHNGGFHVNPSVRTGMVNPLQNFWIGDTNLNDWISVLAPTPTWDTLSGKPTFATVATSGAYSDLSGKPTIPTTAADVGAVSTNGATMTGALVMKAPIVIRGAGLAGVQFSDTVLYVLDGNGLPSRILTYSEIAQTSDIPTSMVWGAITGKPTTISGYGITDALKSDFTSLTNNVAFSSAVAAVSPPTDTSELEARGFVRIVADDEIYFVTITTTQTEE